MVFLYSVLMCKVVIPSLIHVLVKSIKYRTVSIVHTHNLFRKID